MASVQTAAGLDSIAGNEAAKLCDFIHDDIGRTNVDAHQPKLGEDA